MASRWLAIIVSFVALAVATCANASLYGSAFTGAAGPATLFLIDDTNGNATAIGPIGFNRVGALAFSLALLAVMMAMVALHSVRRRRTG